MSNTMKTLSSLKYLIILIILSVETSASTSEGELQMVVEICRHGARAPVTRNYNVTKQYWQNGLERLTEIGERQHYLLGTELRNRYINQYQLLGNTYNSSQLQVYSTFLERTYQSAQAQLLGLYPPGVGPAISQIQKQRAVLPISSEDDEDILPLYDKINAELGDHALEYLYQTIPIYQFTEKSDYLLRAFSDKVCPRISDIYRKNTETEDFKKIQNYYYENLFVPLSSKIGMEISNDWQTMLNVADEIEVAVFDKRQLPINLTKLEQNLLEQFIRDEFYLRRFSSSNREAAYLASNELRKLLVRRFDEKITHKNDLRMLILSSHDHVISMMLSAMDLSQDHAPPFASILLFELWNINGKSTIKAIYNDKELDLYKFCYGKSRSDGVLGCDYERFKEKISVDTYNDISEACSKGSNWSSLLSEYMPEKSSSTSIEGVIVVVFSGILVGAYCIYRIKQRKSKRRNGRQEFELVEETH